MKLEKYRQQQKRLEAEMQKIAEEATLVAIEAAQEATPPAGDLRGTKTRSGGLKSQWATDSTSKPVKRGRELVTVLANNKEYASFVNDGHRMDRHFVPGLYINPSSGLLEYSDKMKGEVGIMVGTKTQYVPGVFMAEKGEDAFGEYLEKNIDRLLEIIK